MTSLDQHYLSVPLGVDDHGKTVLVNLGENAFVVGLPGSGVSNSIHTLIRGVADKPFVELLGIDPYPDLDPWKPRFSELAKTDQDAVSLLTDLEARFEARTGMLARAMSERVGFTDERPSDEVPFIVAVIPELGMLPEEAKPMVSHLVARGRYAGIFFILGGLQAITQNVPLRDLIGNRIAHALPHEGRAQCVFGHEATSLEPHRLDPIQDRGIGYFARSGESGRFTVPYMPYQDVQSFAVMTSPLVPKSLM